MQTDSYAKPFYIFFLLIPAGISQGFVSVALPYLLTEKGFSVQLAAEIVAFGLSANLWRFLGGPIADASLTLKKWFWIGLSATVLTLFLLCIINYSQQQTTLIFILVFISQVAATLTMLPVGGIMANRIAPHEKGAAAGWFQAGNLGGTGIGGGIGLWLAIHYNTIVAAIVLIVIMLLCTWPLFKIKDVISNENKLLHEIKKVGIDIIEMIKMPVALFTVLLISLPIGTGAISYLWSAVGKDWHANVDTIALTTGILSGVFSALGSAAGGYMADKMGVWSSYFITGILSAVTAIVMAVCNYSPVVFIVGVLVYAFVLGMCYAAFSATLLFAIGKKSASTKYSLLSSFANLPVVYMTATVGWAHDYKGNRFMLFTEAFAAIAAVAVCVIIYSWMKRRHWIVKPE
jgi:MFS family permease